MRGEVHPLLLSLVALFTNCVLKRAVLKISLCNVRKGTDTLFCIQDIRQLHGEVPGRPSVVPAYAKLPGFRLCSFIIPK